MRRAGVVLLVLAINSSALAPSHAVAQSIWIDRAGSKAAMVEFLSPEFDDGSDGFGAAMFLSGRMAVSPSLTLVGQIPYARRSAQGTYYIYYLGSYPYDVDEATIGNVYVGIEGTPKSGRIFGEGGIRIPTASDNDPYATSAGIVADVRRSQAFLGSTLSVESAVNFVSAAEAELTYRLRVSPVLEYDVNAASSHLVATYSGQIGYRLPAVRAGAAFSGFVDLSEGYGFLENQTRNQIELHADFLPGPLRPGLEVKIPLGDWSAGVGNVIGASLTWTR